MISGTALEGLALFAILSTGKLFINALKMHTERWNLKVKYYVVLIAIILWFDL